MVDLNVIVGQAVDMEPLPASAARLSTLVTDADADLEAIIKVVELDPSLTGRLLRLANSAVAGGYREVVTVREAVLRVGTATLLALAVAAGARRRMQTPLPEYGLSEGALWRHSAATALAAGQLRSVCREPVPPETSVAALLHDVGKLALVRFLTPETLSAIREVEQGGVTLCEAERRVLDVHHGELGGLIVHRWHLPDSVVEAVTYHDTPDRYEGDDLRERRVCHAVYLANRVAKAVLPVGVEPARPGSGDACAEAMAALGMPAEKLPRLVAKVGECLEDALAAFE